MKLTQFYEVMDAESDILWGGESAYEAVEWFRRTPNAKVQVSVWNTESEDDYRLVDHPIEVTQLIRAVFLCEPFDPKNDSFGKLRVVK
jgi:hypothetical protein